jgi:hypothetical protein
MPFLDENTVMTVYGGRPPSGRHHVSNLSSRARLIVVRDTGLRGVMAQSFPISL